MSRSRSQGLKQPKRSTSSQAQSQSLSQDNSSTPAIKSKLLWAFDSPRKDAKRQARLRGTKFFYLLEIKLCQKDYQNLKCLKGNKPCCKYMVMKLDKPELKIKHFPERRHHLKEFKLVANSKVSLNLHTKFWTQTSSRITAIDYVSNEIAPFKQLIEYTKPSTYRNLKNVSFPIIKQSDPEFYGKVFSFLKQLNSLKILTFNVVAPLEKTATLRILADLAQLKKLKALDINLRGHESEYFETLFETIENLNDLKLFSLQFGGKSPKNIRDLVLQTTTKIALHLSRISHLDLELYIDESSQAVFERFLNGLETLKNLISLNLKIDRAKSSLKQKLNLPETNESVLEKVKYLNLEANKDGLGIDLAKYFLEKMKNLHVCCLKNIELGKAREAEIEDLSESLLRNKQLRELKIVFQKDFSRAALENLVRNCSEFQKLQLYSIQLHNQEMPDFDVEFMVNGVKGLENIDTFVLEILSPIAMKEALFRKLFENLSHLKRLSAIEIDLRLANEVKGAIIKKLFMMEKLDILTLNIENMKLNKNDQKFLKVAAKKLKRITSCRIECEEFKLDRIF